MSIFCAFVSVKKRKIEPREVHVIFVMYCVVMFESTMSLAVWTAFGNLAFL